MCFERRTWAHLTGVRAGSASLLEEIAREEIGSLSEGTLWGTPTAHERTQTPRAVDHGEQLANQAAQWPTPTAGDARASGSRNTPGSAAHAGVSLSDMVTTGDSLGRQDRTTPTAGPDGSPRAVLNPCFVEALQGFPAGWTDCVVLEMP